MSIEASLWMTVTVSWTSVCVQSARQDTFRCGVRRHCLPHSAICLAPSVCTTLITCKLIHALFVVSSRMLSYPERNMSTKAAAGTTVQCTEENRDNLWATNRFRLILDCNLRAKSERMVSDCLGVVRMANMTSKKQVLLHLIFSFSTNRSPSLAKVKVESAKRHSPSPGTLFSPFLLFLL